MHLCNEFQEAYKSLDKLCREYLSGYDGVSGYIRLMENEWYGEHYVSTWNKDLKMLKHVRWVRNQLSHEVGTLESDICSWSDLEFVDDFYKRIINTTDPLAMLRQAQKIENQKKNIHKKGHDSNSQDENKASGFDQKMNKERLILITNNLFCIGFGKKLRISFHNSLFGKIFYGIQI